MKSRASLSIFLAATLLIASCGGGDGASTAASPAAARLETPQAAANSGGVFTGVRNNYTISRTSTGVTVVDSVGKEGTTTLSSAVTVLKFSDVSVNLGVGTRAASIATADLKTLIELYIAYFNRVPDAEGLSYWIDQYKAGLTLEQIGKSFYDAALQYSSLTGYTASMVNSDFVKLVYKNVLGRSTVDQAGLDYWSGALAKGSETRGTLVKTILGSAHTFKGDATYGAVADLLDNKVAVANTFAVQQGLTYTSASDSITKGMAMAAAVTATTAAARLIGVADAAFNLAPNCLTPATLVNGVCVQPPNLTLRPSVGFSVALSSGGWTYTAQLCWEGSIGCDSLGSPVFVSNADFAAAKGDIVAALAMAGKVADEYNNMIGRLWAANTVPPRAVLLAVFKAAIATAVQSGSAANAVSDAGKAFTAAGYPAAAGGSTTAAASNGSSVSSNATTGSCNIANYAGPNTDPQFDTFCQNAFINNCLDTASGTTAYQSQTRSVCGVLDGLLKATGGSTAAKYCGYCR
jgi:hypothetical protein